MLGLWYLWIIKLSKFNETKIKYLILILLAICLEYFRDYLFININFQIDFLENSVNNLEQFNNTDSNIHSFIHNLDISKLKSIKWILSLYLVYYTF